MIFEISFISDDCLYNTLFKDFRNIGILGHYVRLLWTVSCFVLICDEFKSL